MENVLNIKSITSKRHIDSVYTKENRMVSFRTKQFYASCINAKQLQMVPSVIKMEEECALNHENPDSLVFGA